MKKLKELFIKNKKLFISIISCVCTIVFVGVVAVCVSLNIEKKHAHVWREEIVREATCKKEGLKKIVCTVEGCDEERSDTIAIDPEAHNKKAATCESASKCIDCGEVFGPKLPHNYLSATCTEAATCSNCGAIDYNNPAKGHTYEDVEKMATCTEDGYKKTVCSVCGDQSSEEVIPATGHAWSNGLAKATQVDVCVNCGLEASKNLRYQLVGNTYYVVIGVGNNRTEEIIIPTVHNSLPVKQIAAEAFREYVELKSVLIIDSDLVIGDRAFVGCKNLVSVKVVDTTVGNVVVGDQAFIDCTSLKEVVLGNQVKELGAEVFSGCQSLATIQLSQNIETIGEKAFYGCKSLKNIAIPDATKSIGNEAFCGCTNLEEVELGEKLDAISNGLFQDCTNLKNIKIPDSVKTIGDNAFKNCKSIERMTIASDVESVGKNAFENCSKLLSVSFPDSLATIGEDAFIGCEKLVEVSIKDIKEWCEIEFKNAASNPFAGKAELYLNGVKDTSIVIHDEIYEIKAYAFYGYDTMTDLVIGKGVKDIASWAFAECTGLKNITYLATTCAASEGNAFYKAGQGSTGIKVVIGKAVRRVPAYLFYTEDEMVRPDAVAANITTVSFEEGSVCNLIDDYAFSNCGNIQTLTIGENVKTIGLNAFSNGQEESATYNKLTTLVIPDGIEAIREGAFAYCESIKTATLPAKAIKEISKKSLETLTVTSGSIGANALESSQKLTIVTLGEKVYNIGTRAFYDCPVLKIVKAENVTVVGEEAFAYCVLLKEFTSASLQTITSKAFYDCASLKSIVLPESMRYIGKEAFRLCNSLTSVDFEYRYQWTVSSENVNAKPLHDTDLAGKAKAASFLTDMEWYCNYNWICRK